MELSNLPLKTKWGNGKDVKPVLFDQDFGFELDKFSAFPDATNNFTKEQLQELKKLIIPIDSGFSKVSETDSDFEVHLRVKPFKMEDIKVTIEGNVAKVLCEHPFVEEGQGKVRRRFIKIYTFPENSDPNTLKAFVKSDGILVLNCKKVEFKERNVTLGLSLCDENAPV